MKEIITNCPLCGERSLSIMEQEKSIQQDSQIAENKNTFKNLQCLNCGYASSDKFIGNKSDNEEYSKLTTEMQDWAVEQDDRIWIPAMLTLPFGMVYPLNVDNMVNHKTEMKWHFANMIEISEEEKEKYPVEGQEGKFYERRIDVDNAKIYESFLDGMSELNNRMKGMYAAEQKSTEKNNSPKLPKLRRA